MVGLLLFFSAVALEHFDDVLVASVGRPTQRRKRAVVSHNIERGPKSETGILEFPGQKDFEPTLMLAVVV